MAVVDLKELGELIDVLRKRGVAEFVAEGKEGYVSLKLGSLHQAQKAALPPVDDADANLSPEERANRDKERRLFRSS